MVKEIVLFVIVEFFFLVICFVVFVLFFVVVGAFVLGHNVRLFFSFFFGFFGEFWTKRQNNKYLDKIVIQK